MNSLDDKRIKAIWLMVYNIAINMLHNIDEAEDATQQIFLKVIEKYESFNYNSKLETWIYKISKNYLLDYKQKAFNREISFEEFAKDITSFDPYLGELNLTREETKIYTEEIKVGCTLAMLQCLDPENRFIYILGNIFNFSSKEASTICNITEESYRKRLSRSRKKITNFVNNRCGLVDSNNYCRCSKRLLIAKEQGRIEIGKHLYQDRTSTIQVYINEMNSIESNIFRENPLLDNRELYSWLKNKFSILQEHNNNYLINRLTK